MSGVYHVVYLRQNEKEPRGVRHLRDAFHLYLNANRKRVIAEQSHGFRLTSYPRAEPLERHLFCNDLCLRNSLYLFYPFRHIGNINVRFKIGGNSQLVLHHPDDIFNVQDKQSTRAYDKEDRHGGKYREYAHAPVTPNKAKPVAGCVSNRTHLAHTFLPFRL